MTGGRPSFQRGAAREPAVQAEAVVLEQDEDDDEQQRARDHVCAEDIERLGERWPKVTRMRTLPSPCAAIPRRQPTSISAP